MSDALFTEADLFTGDPLNPDFTQVCPPASAVKAGPLMKQPRCFWCDDIIEFSQALINPANGKIQCRDCRDLDIMREFTESVTGAVNRLRTELASRREERAHD